MCCCGDLVYDRWKGILGRVNWKGKDNVKIKFYLLFCDEDNLVV